MTEESEQQAFRFNWAWIVRIIVTFVILGLIFRNIEIKNVAETMFSANIGLLLLALLFQLGSTLLAGIRWGKVMHTLEFGMSYLFYIKSYFKGSFFNQGLPTSIGGDAVRVLDVATSGGGRKRDAFIGVFIDRILGLTGLLLLNMAANYFLPDLLPENLFWTINAIVLSGFVGFIVFIYIHHIDMLKINRLFNYVLRMSSNLNRVLHDFRSISFHMFIGVIIHLLSIINIYFIGQSVGLEFDLLTIAVIVPPVVLLTLIPISLAGWGIREGAMVGLFGLVGGNNASILSMSILYGIILIIASLPGLITFLTKNDK